MALRIGIGKNLRIQSSGDSWSTYWAALYPNAEPAWVYSILLSYLSLNSHITYDTTTQGLIYSRLAEDYIITTFGPDGLNKTDCDFFIYFENSNTTTNINPTAATITKTGDTLRWNFGGGNTYDQNNCPEQINNGIITLTSTDGFSGVTSFSLYYCEFEGELFDVSYYFPNVTVFNIGGNAFTGVFPVLPKTKVVNLNIIVNEFEDEVPDLTDFTVLTTFNIYNCPGLTGVIRSTVSSANFKLITIDCLNNYGITGVQFSNVSTSLLYLRFSGCSVPSADIDALMAQLNTYFTANAPTKNLTLNLKNAFNGYLTTGLTNADYLGLVSAYATAAKTLTCTFNYGTFFDKGKIAFTFDDEYISIHTIGLPLFVSKGITGTMYISTDYVDMQPPPPGWAEDTMSWAQLQDLADAGWTMGSHGKAHINYPAHTEAEMEADADGALTDFAAVPFARPYHSAYPIGGNDAVSKRVIAARFRSARIVSGTDAHTMDRDEYVLPCYAIDGEVLDRNPTFAEIKRYIDYAATYKVAIPFLTHAITTGAVTDNYHIELSVLTQVIDYIQGLGTVDIVNLDTLVPQSTVETDSHTLGLFDYLDKTTVTKDVNEKVSNWADKLLSTDDLQSARAAANLPVYSTDGIVFPGAVASCGLRTPAIAALVQPITVYIVLKQVSYTAGDIMVDGRLNGTGQLAQYGVTPNFMTYAGTILNNGTATVGVFQIITMIMNGLNSRSQVNDIAEIVGACGAGNMGGLTLNAGGANDYTTFNNNSDLIIKGVIIRDQEDDATERTEAKRYLKNKYSIT